MSTERSFQDAQLEIWAGQPASELFPRSRSLKTISPWLIVLSVIPAVCSALIWTLHDQDAGWALRALDGLQPLETPLTELNSLQAAPPLATWLTSLAMWIFGVDSRISWICISCLAVAGTTYFAAKIANRIGSPTLALLTAICCAGHPLLLNSAQSCRPEALGVCFLTISLERWLAHQDSALGSWSGRLVLSGLAWAASWLTLGWPALTLGLALVLDTRLYRLAPARVTPTVASAQHDLQHSLITWWLIGIVLGCWWMLEVSLGGGLLVTFQWLLDSNPNPISPLYPRENRIVAWGNTIGISFLMGWIVLGIITLFSSRPQRVLGGYDGRRALVVMQWWIIILVCRLISVLVKADPTLWDVLQVVPACLTAACGIDLVSQRQGTARWIVAGVVAGIVSLAVHAIYLKLQTLHWTIYLGFFVGLIPILINLWQSRGFDWSELQRKFALQGLILSSLMAHLCWGTSHAYLGTPVERRLAHQLTHLQEALPNPGAIIIVTDMELSPALAFQLRRCWPHVPVKVSERWETAVSQNFSQIDSWSTAEFLVVELTRTDSQFLLLGTGWIATSAGEPSRYHGEKLAMHRVKIQSP